VPLNEWKAEQAAALNAARVAEAKARRAELPQAVVRTGPSSH
jgi:hypothetical protein